MDNSQFDQKEQWIQVDMWRLTILFYPVAMNPSYCYSMCLLLQDSVLLMVPALPMHCCWLKLINGACWFQLTAPLASTSAAAVQLHATAASTVTTSHPLPPAATLDDTSVVGSAPAVEGGNPRQWSKRRRPQVKPLSNPVAVRLEAAAKIAAAQDEKKAYYQAKMEMRRVEHEQRMKVMRMEEELLEEKLRRIKGGAMEEEEEWGVRLLVMTLMFVIV